MICHNVTKQWGAAVIANLLEILKPLCLWIGSKPDWDVRDISFEDCWSSKIVCRRYSLAEILEGASWKNMKALNFATAWALEGVAMGKERI